MAQPEAREGPRTSQIELAWSLCLQGGLDPYLCPLPHSVHFISPSSEPRLGDLGSTVLPGFQALSLQQQLRKAQSSLFSILSACNPVQLRVPPCSKHFLLL